LVKCEEILLIVQVLKNNLILFRARGKKLDDLRVMKTKLRYEKGNQKKEYYDLEIKDKGTNNDLQNTTKKPKDPAIRTPPIVRRVSSSFSTFLPLL